jgi:hypothetical protein
MEKVGRNDPCPCGSGKKYKKCCELKASRSKIANPTILTGSNKLSSLFHQKMAPPAPEAPKDDLEKKE